ncbi:Uncharacterised protein [Serratia fonticola]|nr:Uncharacterised protein [Serratia fonticola]
MTKIEPSLKGNVVFSPFCSMDSEVFARIKGSGHFE